MNLVICYLGKKSPDHDNSIIRSPNHEMYLQRVEKFTLSEFDDK